MASTGKTAEDYAEQYTKPKLRERLKEEIKQGDKGGKPGQWSARKSQMLTQEYENQGGGYNHEKTEDQKDLERWTAEDWQTKEGEAWAGHGDQRYLPKRAWDLLSEADKRATEAKKRGADEQFVANTPAARAARKYVSEGDASELSVAQLERLSKRELDELAREHDVHGRSKMDKHELAEAIHDCFSDEAGDAEHETRTKGELYARAQELEIGGRSKMDEHELAEAVAEAEAGQSA